jgi:hypothetical protein
VGAHGVDAVVLDRALGGHHQVGGVALAREEGFEIAVVWTQAGVPEV